MTRQQCICTSIGMNIPIGVCLSRDSNRGLLSLRAMRLASYQYAEGAPFRVIDNLNLLPLTWLVVTLSHRAMAMATEYYWEISPNFWVSALTTEPLGWQELVVTICVHFGQEF